MANIDQQHFEAVLDGPVRDFGDGELLRPGQRVLRNPLAKQIVRKADDAGRRLFTGQGFAWDEPTRVATWQPEPSAPVLAEVSQAAQTGELFMAAVATNLHDRIGHKMPVTRLPLSAVFLPVRLVVRSVNTAADLSAGLINALQPASKLPAGCPPTPATWSAWSRSNKMSVVELLGHFGQRVHVVVAFVTPLQFNAFDGMSVVPVDADAVAAVKAAYSAWAKEISTTAVYFAIGGLAAVRGLEHESVNAVTTIATPANGADAARAAAGGLTGWEFFKPPVATRRAVAEFVDLLRPQSRDVRAAAVAAVVRARVAAGFAGNVTVDWISDQTHYLVQTVRVAMQDLAVAGTHRVYTGPSGAWCIEELKMPSGRVRPPASSSNSRKGYYIRLVIGTTISWAMGYLATKAASIADWQAAGAAVSTCLNWLAVAVNNVYSAWLSDD